MVKNCIKNYRNIEFHWLNTFHLENGRCMEELLLFEINHVHLFYSISWSSGSQPYFYISMTYWKSSTNAILLILMVCVIWQLVITAHSAWGEEIMLNIQESNYKRIVYFQWIYSCCHVFALLVFAHCIRLQTRSLILLIIKKYVTQSFPDLQTWQEGCLGEYRMWN